MYYRILWANKILEERLCVFEFFEAVLADKLALEIGYVVSVTAENAGRLIFFEDDLVLVGEDFNRVVCAEVKCCSELDRDDKTAHRVNFSYDAC